MRVALTFDAEHADRPGCPPDAPSRVLDVLAARDVRATFFLQGRWARAHPQTATRIADEGHLLGSHSFFHARLPLLSDAGLRFDVREAERWIRSLTGASPKPWFRSPWGSRDRRITAALEAEGYVDVGWDVVAEDWEEARSPAQVEDDVVDGVLAAGDPAMVLMHTWPGTAVEALPGIVARLSRRGARFVTVAACRDVRPGESGNPPVAAANPGR